MAISATEILGTIPLGTYVIVSDAKSGITPWKGWASMHRHYAEVNQVAGSTWKNDPETANFIETFRWSLVACAFLFFALFGFAVEAREQYYRLYKVLARRICTSSTTPHGAPHAYVVRSLCFSVLIHWCSFVFCSSPSVPYVKRNGGVTDPIMVQTGRDRDNSSVSLTLTDRPSVPSISMESIPNSDSTAVQDSHSDTVSFYTAKSFDGSEPGGMHDECQSAPQAGILSTVRPASVPPHFPGASEPTMPVHASSGIETV